MSNELTNIEVIVFEDDQGNPVEMEIIDEFDHGKDHYIALMQLPDIDGELDEDPTIQFYCITEAGDEEIFDLVEDAALRHVLADRLEERLFQK